MCISVPVRKKNREIIGILTMGLGVIRLRHGVSCSIILLDSINRSCWLVRIVSPGLAGWLELSRLGLTGWVELSRLVFLAG